ncbi:hypothetical protein K474DRAFT_172513 [Panus rudis PR-1116 ss-1]|nr:hypothetical protein K474DRAFT_172513 [Panus rudis PR-1116 ss-1]
MRCWVTRVESPRRVIRRDTKSSVPTPALRAMAKRATSWTSPFASSRARPVNESLRTDWPRESNAVHGLRITINKRGASGYIKGETRKPDSALELVSSPFSSFASLSRSAGQDSVRGMHSIHLNYLVLTRTCSVPSHSLCTHLILRALPSFVTL